MKRCRKVPWVRAGAIIGVLFAVRPCGAQVRDTSPAGDSPASRADGSQKLARQVLGLLSAKCFACHGDDPEKIKGELNLRSREGMLEGGESGEPALTPGQPRKSRLYIAVTGQDADLEMPPKAADRLTADQIRLLGRWITAGAPWPTPGNVSAPAWKQDNNDDDGVRVSTSGGQTPEWTRRLYKRQDLWAYRPIRRPAVPGGEEDRHPIDAFVDRKLRGAGLTATGRADRRTLIRRATYDLLGLPPTPEQIDAFVADSAPDAFSRLVDRLLRSPHYGEKQARRWLDIVRYADTAGFANDFERPNAWRYRDYVIRSFNDDKPFDRFIIEQLAGDELDPGDVEMRIAVGFLRMGPWEHTGMSVAAVTRQQYLDDITNAVGETFLGQILRCASCHDHKFDPVPTKDYYRLQAVFTPVQFAEPATPFLPEENQAGFEAGVARMTRLLAQTRAQAKAIDQKKRDAEAAWLRERGLDPSKAGKRQSLPEDKRPPRNLGLSQQDLGVRKVLQKRTAYFTRQSLRYEPYGLSVYNGVANRYRSNKARHDVPAPEKRSGAIARLHVLDGGALEAPGEAVTPGVLSAMHGANDAVEPTAWNTIPEVTTGRRLALAKWIASPSNTLTARVIVNRIWQQHFGNRGLVGSPNNFGKMGRRPTHPELLDWLATWFIEHDWSIKKLHRLILTSQTYQRSGRHAETEKVRQVDPNNALLAYYPPRRLSAEELRDSLLAVSGELNRALGGPSVYPEIHLEVALQPRHIMGSVAPAYQPSPRPEERHRRTIYAYRMRGLSDPMLDVFNQPGADISCARRDETTVTPQVFTLFNGQYTYDRALALAHRIAESSPGPVERIEQAFRLVFGRRASQVELDRCREHLEQMVAHHRAHEPVVTKPPTSVTRSMIEEMTGVAFTWDETLDVYKSGYVPDLKPVDVGPETRALAELCLVLLNANEFVYVY